VLDGIEAEPSERSTFILDTSREQKAAFMPSISNVRAAARFGKSVTYLHPGHYGYIGLCLHTEQELSQRQADELWSVE